MVASEEYRIEPELKGTVPRVTVTSKYLKSVRMMMLAFALLTIGLIVSLGTEWYHKRLLLDHGVLTQGEVKSRNIYTGKSTLYHIDYQFTVQETGWSGEQNLSYDAYQQATQSVEVVYLPSDPAIHQVGRVTSEQVQESALNMVGLPLVWGGMVAFCSFIFDRTSRNPIWLVRNGTPVTATLVKVEKITSFGHVLKVTYNFNPPVQPADVTIASGTTEGFVNLRADECKDWKPGQQVTALYDPNQPSCNGLYLYLQKFARIGR